MKLPRPEYVFLAVLGVGILAVTVAIASPFWYASPLLYLLLCGVLYATRTWHDRALYLLCAGQLLIIGSGAVNLWSGLFAVWMLAGIVLGILGLLGSQPELRTYLLFCLFALVIAAGIEVSNHVLLPLLVLGSAAILFVAAVTIRDYRLKKQYTGAPS
jgi:hypothetical protein